MKSQIDLVPLAIYVHPLERDLIHERARQRGKVFDAYVRLRLNLPYEPDGNAAEKTLVHITGGS